MKKRSRRKYKVTNHAGFNIRQIGENSFMADVCSHGQRERKCFSKISEAKTFCELKGIEAQNIGAAAFDITDRDRIEFVEARKLLGTIPVLEAVEFYLKHHRPNRVGITVEELITAYLTAPGKRGRNKAVNRRPDTIRSATWRLKAFTREFGNRKAYEVTESDIESWLDENKWQGQNRKHYLANVHALFDYARRKRLLTLNPAAEIEKPDVEEPAPEIMQPADVRTLLRKTEVLAPELLPSLVVQFFAGLRPKEARELDWSDINFQDSFIRVIPAVAKMKRQRLVDISPNLAAWLVPHRRKDGPLWEKASNTFYIRFRGVKTEAGISVPDNPGRHCFSSYHLALHAPEETAKQLGHSDTELLFTTYRGLVTKNAAGRYWDISPKPAQKVIAFSRSK